jgi:hypothetical protein
MDAFPFQSTIGALIWSGIVDTHKTCEQERSGDSGHQGGINGHCWSVGKRDDVQARTK